MKLVCKDCHESMEDCSCLQDTVDTVEPIIQTREDAEIFIEALTNPPEPNETLIDAAKRYALYAHRVPSIYFGKPEHQLESEIEHLIIRWNLDGTRTAGDLTREIIKLIK